MLGVEAEMVAAPSYEARERTHTARVEASFLDSGMWQTCRVPGDPASLMDRERPVPNGQRLLGPADQTGEELLNLATISTPRWGGLAPGCSCRH